MNHQELSQTSFFWVLQGLCALHRKPFSIELAQQQCAAPYSNHALQSALDEAGLLSVPQKCSAKKLHKQSFPLIAWCRNRNSETSVDDQATHVSPALILQADEHNVLVVEQIDSAPQTISLEQFQQRYTGQITRVTPKIDPGIDADSAEQERQARRFGFSWFVPELLKHKKTLARNLTGISGDSTNRPSHTLIHPSHY